MSRHINTPKKKISPYILISGNPERTKWAAETFLENPELVNSNRLNYIYTGIYKGLRVSLATSGMGIPSMEIYAIELIREYDVQVIIRTGTAGNLSHKFDIFDLAIVQSASFQPDFEKNNWKQNRDNFPTPELFQKIINVAEQTKQKIIIADVYSSNNFYADLKTIKEHTENGKFSLTDMETAVLFSIGKILKCKTGAILMISDNIGFKNNKETNFDDRVKGTEKMFKLGLNTLVAFSKKK